MTVPKLELDGRLRSLKPTTEVLKRYFWAAAARHIPKVIEAVGAKAAAGDVEAAQLLAEITGLRLSFYPLGAARRRWDTQSPFPGYPQGKNTCGGEEVTWSSWSRNQVKG